jgi:hypothetical protein
MCLYHTLLCVCNLFNIFPFQELVTAGGSITAPFELYVGSMPIFSCVGVFGCHCITKTWTIRENGKPKDNSKGAQRVIKGNTPLCPFLQANR